MSSSAPKQTAVPLPSLAHMYPAAPTPKPISNTPVPLPPIIQNATAASTPSTTQNTSYTLPPILQNTHVPLPSILQHKYVPPPMMPQKTHVPLPPIPQSAMPQCPRPLGERNVNTVMAPKPQTDGTNKKKRKSTASEPEDAKAALFPEGMEEIDDDDHRLTRMPDETCNQVRRKIRNWIESGAQKVGEFQNTIVVSSPAYNRFMKLTKPWDGQYTDTYVKAMLFFRKREILGLPIKAPQAKKAKKTSPEQAKKAEALLDVTDVEIPGEDKRAVPVFETPKDIRRQIRALLAKDGITQAAFVRAVNEHCLPKDDGKSINAMNMRTFMGHTDIMGGNASTVFYGAYVFFEKRRIKENKPKSKWREEMEGAHGPRGVNVEHNSKGHIFCFGNERPYYDKYGRLQFTRA